MLLFLTKMSRILPNNDTKNRCTSISADRRGGCLPVLPSAVLKKKSHNSETSLERTSVDAGKRFTKLKVC